MVCGISMDRDGRYTALTTKQYIINLLITEAFSNPDILHQ